MQLCDLPVCQHTTLSACLCVELGWGTKWEQIQHYRGEPPPPPQCFLVVHLSVQLTARYPGSSWFWAEWWGWKDLSFWPLVVRLAEVCCQTPGLRTAADSLQGDSLLSALLSCSLQGAEMVVFLTSHGTHFLKEKVSKETGTFFLFGRLYQMSF